MDAVLHLDTPAAAGGSSHEETRVDPSDGHRYTKREFFTCYGGYAQWDALLLFGSQGRG
eukprot:gene4220-47661_t